MSWWDGLAGEVGDPSWVAGVLANGLSAAIAIVGAWWVLQRQLRAERTSRRAERRGDVARAAGYRMLDILEQSDDPIDDRGNALRSQGFRDDGVAHRLLDPIRDVDRVFGRDHDLDWLWLHRLTLWEAARSVAAERSESDDGRSVFELGFAWDRMVWPNTRLLLELGRLWVRWDGHGDLPRIDRTYLAELSGLPDDTDGRDRWVVEVVAPRFREALQRAKAGLPPWP